jgi:hypothetical protein
MKSIVRIGLAGLLLTSACFPQAVASQKTLWASKPDVAAFEKNRKWLS